MKIQVNDMLRNMCGIYKLDYPMENVTLVKVKI